MRGKKIYMMIGVLLVVSICSCLTAKAQTIAAPDFKGYFKAIRESRVEYNRYTDSLFMIKNKGEWIELVKRRTFKTQQLYDANAQRQHQVEAAALQYKENIPMKAYADLFDYFHNQTYAKQELDNPLTLLAVCQVFDYGGQRVLDSLKCINVVNTWKLYSYSKLWNLGGNVDYLKKAYECGKFILSDEAKKYPYYDYALAQALRYMPKTVWLVRHVGTVAEYRKFCHQLDEFLARPDIHQVVSSNVFTELHKIQETADEALVRNTYLVGDTVLSKQEADSLMKVIIQRNLANKNLSCLSRIRTYFMQMQMGQITANQARELSLQRYRLNWPRIKGRRLSSTELNDYLQPFYTFFYLNYKATIPYEEKRKTVVDMCHDIESAYLNRLNHEGTTDYVRDLLSISTYDKVTMYLTPEEVAMFLNTLNVASQATTFARSEVSAEMSEDIMRDVLKYKPELLVGQMGCNSIDEVKKKSKDFLKFIKEAALFHDIGMNSIASVVKSEFRPMFKEEREIFERHPEYGLQYLKLTPVLQKYKDITLGHHKWYDGKGGFPEDFDNTKSPERILTEIVSLSDGVLQLTKQLAAHHALENIGEQVIREIKAGSGTLYNPGLVELLLAQSDISRKVRDFAEKKWADKFYEVFKKNFFDRDKN